MTTTNTTPIPTVHLSPEALAEREDVSVETVYQWNRTKTGPPYFKAGRHARYRLNDIVEWEESRMVSRSDRRPEAAA